MMTLGLATMHWGYTARNFDSGDHGLQPYTFKPCNNHSPVFSLGAHAHTPQDVFPPKNFLGGSPQGHQFLANTLEVFSPTSKAKRMSSSPAAPLPFAGMPKPQGLSPAKGGIWLAEDSGPKYRGFNHDKLQVPPLKKRKYRKRTLENVSSSKSLMKATQVLTSPSATKDKEAVKNSSPDSPDSSASLHKRTYQCHDCQYVTDRKNNLKRHIATMHERCTKLLECCDTVFANKALLREHVRSCHSHGYDCKVCGRTFCRKALLKRHITVHSGQKDFVCGLCGYATSHKSNLDRHKRRHLPKHLRKPTFFSDLNAAGNYGSFPGSAGGSAMVFGSDGDGLEDKPMAPVPSNPLAYQFHGAYYGQAARGFRFTSAGRYPQVKMAKRTAFQSRERRMLKKKLNSSYKKIIMMKFGNKDQQHQQQQQQQQQQQDQQVHNQDVLNNDKIYKNETDNSPAPAVVEELKADDNDLKQSLETMPYKLPGLRFRLAPCLHKCKECDVVFTGQLDLIKHLEDNHSKENGFGPQRPLTLQMRPKNAFPSASQSYTWAVLVN